MKLFDFECLKCGTVFESLVKSEEEAPACKECNGPTKKIFSANYKIRMDDYRNRKVGHRYT